MAYDYTKNAAKRFSQLGPKNPLRTLSGSDQGLLMALLVMYKWRPRPDPSNPSELLEEASRVAGLAGSLSKKMQATFFDGALAGAFDPLLAGYKDLPLQLDRFSSRIKLLLDQLGGKAGHKGKTTTNQFLVTASEFVRLKTGTYNDEHLAELMQTLWSDADPESLKELSGDAIRKKREHLKSTYAILYARAVSEAGKFAGKPGKPYYGKLLSHTEKSLTRNIQRIVTMSKEPLTAAEIRDELVKLGDSMEEQSNALATIHVIANGLSDDWAIRETLKDGKKAWRALRGAEQLAAPARHRTRRALRGDKD